MPPWQDVISAPIPNSRDIAPEETPLVGVPLTITKSDRPRTVYPPLRLIDRTHWYIGEERARIVHRHRRRHQHYRAPPELLLTAIGTAMTKKRLFYAPSLRVLEQDLMPAFPATLRRRAEALAQTLPPLPEVE